MIDTRQVIEVRADFRVVGEADDWIIVDKPAPLVVHPTSGKVEPTLLGGVQQLLCYDMENGAKLSIINRLDRETSGLVLIAKNSSMARYFGRAMERRQVEKVYQALVFGWPSWDELVVAAPILRQGEVRESAVWVKQCVHSAGKSCETHFKVEGRYLFPDGLKVTKMRVQPQTGRMHQIRVHAAHCGYPLVGDKIYGIGEWCYLQFIEKGWSESLLRALVLSRHALHASEMVIADDPEFDWKIDLADDLEGFLHGADRML